METVEKWAQLSGAFDLGGHSAQVLSLPREIGVLCSVIQGLLIHGDWLDAYGLTPSPVSRTTLPVAERLEAILALRDAPLGEARRPERRSVGTCRDYALMLAAFLRRHGAPARLRCGFASYFNDDWEDHWLCEYWDARAGAWRLADAQLDDVLSERLRIDFDPGDVPRARFKAAGEAWRACRIAPAKARRFGHGDVKGQWFIGVNVWRDHLALHDEARSPWDRWREASPAARHFRDADLPRFDRLSADPEQTLVEGAPPWLS